ncbi:MAG TPA: pectinesterase family protein [Polyangia bacterium]|nr:pectinesterase family protein [Polyangia bacterium]
MSAGARSPASARIRRCRSRCWFLAPALVAAACVGGAAGPGDGAGGETGNGSGGTTILGVGGTGAGGGSGGSGARDGGGADVTRDSGAGGAGVGGSTGAGGSNVVLPAGVSGLFPAPGAAGVCPDPPLRITFPAPPALGMAGRIRVWNAAQTTTPVATVDMAVAMASDTIGGLAFNVLRPVFVEGNAAVIYLRQRALTYGQTYYVTVESGAIRPAGGAALAITSATAWRFTTAAAAPTNRAALGVALDGSASLCSVQGAIDLLPSGDTGASTITIAPGTYHEIIRLTAKNNVRLHGADRAGTVIAATNNNNQNAGTAIRSLVGIDSCSGLVIENLTIQNLTPQDGSQAEALRLQRCDQCIVRNANLLSLQDTLLLEGRVYVDNSLIAGNVDFVWGVGVAYFNNCEIRTAVRSGFNVQARNAVNAYGYVFVDCRLTSDAGLTNNSLARIDAGVYPGSHVAYINCVMGPHISAAGWTINAGTPTASLRFWEYQSRTPAGALVDVSRRVAGVQISAAQATMMRTPAIVLGGWTPPAN